MPKVKLCRAQTDPIKGLILERKHAWLWDDEKMAEKMGVSRATYQKRINHQHTNDWPHGQILRICKALDIPIQELRDATRY